MLFLPAAALCCLCSALVAMAADLTQDQLTWTRRVGQTVSFRCEGTGQCSFNDVYWYQKKETETFKRILRINKSNGRINKGYNHPQEDDFSSVNKQNSWELEIKKVKVDHSASYYCSCLETCPGGDEYYIFGSGTKLHVTDERVVKPVVSVYPAASRPNQEGKSSLLCPGPSSMFPPEVQFSWKRQKKGGSLEDLTSAQGDQLELRESGHRASIRLVDTDDLYMYTHYCYIEHEGGTVNTTIEEKVEDRVEAQTHQGVPAPAASCLQRESQQKLLCLLYTVLIVKISGVCCGLSLLTSLTNKEPSTSSTHAD
ncbi:immunoglobulin lambda-1 light chain-like [Mugil cephalus]|uniref:immunoglobulin lambda-1 light chain-like n=1 Tax=Mugil cephalus TaxID=48193 RepID=UPI001FB6AD28|nr:immunoglobulin lambda-1 light chain-like [Mugil cephalus]